MPTRAARLPVLATVLLSAAGWTAVGAVFALPNLGGADGPWAALRASLATWWAWALLLPAIVAVSRRLPAQPLAFRIVIHLLLSLPFAQVAGYLGAALAALLGVGSWATAASSAPWQAAMHGGVLWSMLVYLVIAGASEALRFRDDFQAAQLRIERLERGFSEARLSALRSQLDPHFLFNALNTVSALVTSRPGMARHVIEQLGELLRHSLDGGQRMHVRLDDELQFLRRYVAIQEARFGDRIAVVTHVGEGAGRILVPSLLLQPLVENAIRHGLAPAVAGGTVRVDASLVGGSLHLVVEDDGVGLPADWSWAHAGVGLGVSRERLGVLYPDVAEPIVVAPRASGGTRVHVTLPAALDPADAH
ncbi:sensor histidine kinase [Luteibacter yeojuensis]|uniref:Histidine kinase domain-containing protein n=1 Tax=Luteibacter yeojuensis TaxID=345309 RepID=A0A0F3KMS7_9GAMM|nr:histidine kinase [Luteibacter yeojuensis]KJV32508.1 hypothetical protein VI08_12285 [Luteibacter yeojuensis]